MSLLYIVLLVLMFGGAATWVFMWAIQNGTMGMGQDRARREGLLEEERRKLAEAMAANKPGLEIRPEKAPDEAATEDTEAEPETQRAAGGDAA